jgi:uncharacterized protein YceH (UPF0502 family)
VDLNAMASAPAAAGARGDALSQRVVDLEAQVQRLQARLAHVYAQLGLEEPDQST